jgi:acetoacetyl-CoA synthetase
MVSPDGRAVLLVALVRAHRPDQHGGVHARRFGAVRLAVSDYADPGGSPDRPGEFWEAVDFSGLRAATRGGVAVEHLDRMPGAAFFPGARLNIAENLLGEADTSLAIVFRGEDRVRRELTRAELHAAVSRLVQAFVDMGVTRGDRVAAYLPNVPEAGRHDRAASLRSSRPSTSACGVFDRLGQIAPKIVISATFPRRAMHDSGEKLRAILDGLPTVEHTIVVPYTRRSRRSRLRGGGSDRAGALSRAADRVRAAPVDQPLYPVFVGTTGARSASRTGPAARCAST